jgi:uncharacterized membrane protein
MTSNEDPTFTQSRAQDIWTDYVERVESLCGFLDPRQKSDIVLELKAHLLESYVRLDGGSEVSRISEAIEKLGNPDDFVPLWVEERLLDGAQPGQTSRNLFSLLRSNARKGASQFAFSMLVGFGYLLSFYFFVMAVLKIFFPENIGLHLAPNGIPILGYVDVDEFSEVLGYWLIPIGLSATFLLQYLLNKLVRRWVRYHGR